MPRTYTQQTIKLLFGGASSCAFPGCSMPPVLVRPEPGPAGTDVPYRSHRAGERRTGHRAGRRCRRRASSGVARCPALASTPIPARRGRARSKRSRTCSFPWLSPTTRKPRSARRVTGCATIPRRGGSPIQTSTCWPSSRCSAAFGPTRLDTAAIRPTPHPLRKRRPPRYRPPSSS